MKHIWVVISDDTGRVTGADPEIEDLLFGKAEVEMVTWMGSKNYQMCAMDTRQPRQLPRL